MIAADLAIDVKTAALLSTAFAFPYALIQPVLGVTGDFFGKTRLMNVCVLVMAICGAHLRALRPTSRCWSPCAIVAGLVAGGVFPVAMALFGDLVPMNQRQVAIARLLGIALTANVLGASIAGVIGDLFGWRGVFAILGRFRFAVSVLAFWALRNTKLRRRRRSAAPRSSPTSKAYSPTRAPRSASAPCSLKPSSSRGCFPMSPSCCTRSARHAPRSPAF